MFNSATSKYLILPFLRGVFTENLYSEFKVTISTPCLRGCKNSCTKNRMNYLTLMLKTLSLIYQSPQKLKMKAKNLFAMVAFAGLGLMAEGALAQGNEQSAESTPPPATEEAAPAAPEAEPYNETVTIDNGTQASSAGSTDAGFSAQPEKKERLRVYSGKHDGNNVIYDPR